MAYRRLGELLLAAGAVSEEDLQRGLELQKHQRERLGTILLSRGIITETTLLQALQTQMGIDFVDLTRVPIPMEMARLLPKSIARMYHVAPVRLIEDRLYLAMSDPMNFYAIEDARRASRKKVVPLAATEAGVEHAIQVLYSSENAVKAVEEMRREVGDGTGEAERNFVANQLGEDSADTAPAIRLVNTMLELAISQRASDIHMEPRESCLRIRMRIDGVMREVFQAPRNIAEAVAARVKVMAAMNIAERRLPQDGRFQVRVRDREIDLRISTLPTALGEKIVLRLLDRFGGAVTEASIGLTGEDFEKYQTMLRSRHGMILLAGPTGSGKSTTLYAMLNRLNTTEVNLVTLEDPVEYHIDGVNQVQINEKTGLTFAHGLRAILRQDPDIIAVGEIRDGETAEIAIRAAVTGHLVISTVHTNDAVGAVERLRDIGVEPYMIASSLRGVISQRLVRCVCPFCRRLYHPSEEELRALRVRVPPGMRFSRGAGCPRCFNTGYRGRTAVFELLTVTPRLRALIYDRRSRDAMEAELQRVGSSHVSLYDNALRLVREGVTTSDEILRVVNQTL